MARAPKKTNEKLSNKNIEPIRAVAEGLILVGKPFYFILSYLIVGIAYLLQILGRGVQLPFVLITRAAKIKKGAKKKKTEKFKSTKKRKKIKFKLPKISPLIRIEWLRVSLFELKIISKIKDVFTVKISRFQKYHLKKKITIIALLIAILSAIFYFYYFIFRTLPSPKELGEHTPDVSTKIYDRNGNLLFKIYKNQNRTVVPLSQIPMHVRLATLAAEDAEFYSHPGFSVRGIFRAMITDIETGSMQGGSTITQQLVKNTLLSPEKTLSRKVKELILSVEVETEYTKDQILDMYLNEVSYGGTAYGIEEASQEYFGKDVQDLDLAEAALLAGLPKSPTSYSPFGQNPALAIERQREVLHLMRINKFITQEQEEAALNERLTFVPNKTDLKAPHFVMYIRQILVDKYGEDMVDKGGLEVTTSLDLSIQEMAEQVVKSEVDKLKGLHVGNGAAMVIDPKTGEILAMVGSKDYFDTAYDGQVNVATSLRQPGSSIKVVNYTYALENAGYTPATIIDDSPITYVTPGSAPYSPVNYDGQFKGEVTLRSALAQSRNVPAVKVLASYGVDKMIEEGRKMGITTWTDPSNYGLALTLGGGAVKMTDLTKVYATLADSGKRPDLMPILSIKDYKGKVLEKNEAKNTQVVDPGVAFLLTNILSDNNARAPEFGYNSYLVIKNHPEVAVKTGTSNDLRDNWTVGYNQNYLVATWVGNNDYSPMSRIASGVTGASPIWNKIMSAVLNGKDSKAWTQPDDTIKISCAGKSEWFLKSDVVSNFCNPTPKPTPTSDASNILESGASTIH